MVAAGIVSLVAVSGCSDALEVGVANRCGRSVEVDVSDVHDPVSLGYELSYELVGIGERAGVVDAAEPIDKLFVWVRLAEGDEPVQFSVTAAELVKPPKGTKYDREIVLEGDRCPT